MNKEIEELFSRVVNQNDKLAVSKLLTLVENSYDSLEELFQKIEKKIESKSHIIGVTGSAGAGKSSLISRLISSFKKLGCRIGVLSVDPSSPFSGGALLGDRIRMQEHTLDPNVFIRSVSSRGHIGGISLSIVKMVPIMELWKADKIIIETVGVGQGEVEIVSIADTVVVVTTPVAGDHIQVIKSGINEIADIFVVNKSDLQGADIVAKELEQLYQTSLYYKELLWKPPVILTSTTEGVGIDELITAIENHNDFLSKEGYNILKHKRNEMKKLFLRNLLIEKLESEFREILKRYSTVDPYDLSRRIKISIIID